MLICLARQSDTQPHQDFKLEVNMNMPYEMHWHIQTCVASGSKPVMDLHIKCFEKCSHC